MKISLLTVMASAMMIAPVGATTAQSDRIEQSWSSNGIEITVLSNHKLSTDEKKVFEQKTPQAALDSTHANVTLPGSDSSSTILSGPSYQTYDNSNVYATMNIVLTALNTILTKKISSTSVAAITGAATSYFIRQVPSSSKTYWGFTNTKAYSDYYGAYEDYNTSVRYANSNYTSPIAVYYYDTGVDASGL